MAFSCEYWISPVVNWRSLLKCLFWWFFWLCFFCLFFKFFYWVLRWNFDGSWNLFSSSCVISDVPWRVVYASLYFVLYLLVEAYSLTIVLVSRWLFLLRNGYSMICNWKAFLTDYFKFGYQFILQSYLIPSKFDLSIYGNSIGWRCSVACTFWWSELDEIYLGLIVVCWVWSSWLFHLLRFVDIWWFRLMCIWWLWRLRWIDYRGLEIIRLLVALHRWFILLLRCCWVIL